MPCGDLAIGIVPIERAVGGEGGDRALDLVEQVAELIPGRLLIVGHHRRERMGAHDAILRGATLSGITTRASAPLPGSPESERRSSSP